MMPSTIRMRAMRTFRRCWSFFNTGPKCFERHRIFLFSFFTLCVTHELDSRFEVQLPCFTQHLGCFLGYTLFWYLVTPSKNTNDSKHLQNAHLTFQSILWSNFWFYRICLCIKSIITLGVFWCATLFRGVWWSKLSATFMWLLSRKETLLRFYRPYKSSQISIIHIVSLTRETMKIRGIPNLLINKVGHPCLSVMILLHETLWGYHHPLFERRACYNVPTANHPLSLQHCWRKCLTFHEYLQSSSPSPYFAYPEGTNEKIHKNSIIDLRFSKRWWI